jgi:thymidylate synthase
MKVYNNKYVADAYKDILNDLYYHPEYVSNPRGLEVKEILNCIIHIEEPNMNLFKNEFRSSPKKYIASELLWYFSGTTKSTFIEKYASMWKSLKNEDDEVNSAYGYLLFKDYNEHAITQYNWAIESLKRDKDTRQSFMHFNKPRHQLFSNKDQVCTLAAMFHIRDNKLHMTLNMRSNDVIKGFMTDFVFFNILHQHVYLNIKQYYPEIEMGSYTHISHSMHLYSSNYELVEKMLTSSFEHEKTPDLNTLIVDENGMFFPKYNSVFYPVLFDKDLIKNDTDNDIINWALQTI